MKGLLTTTLMLGGALAAGGGGAYFAKSYMDTRIREEHARLQSEYQMTDVVVARTNLAPGTVLSNQTVAVRGVPKTFLHGEAIPASHWNEIAGRVLARGLKAGETVLKSHLAQGFAAGFSAQLPEGMRAITFPVDEEASISGMLAPGDRIDILFTTTANNESITLPLLFAVPVIATGLRTQANENALPDKLQSAPFRTITVAVTPADAARITLAQDAGRITVALRQPQDQTPIQISRITKNSLLTGDQPIHPGPRRPRIQVILGGV